MCPTTMAKLYVQSHQVNWLNQKQAMKQVNLFEKKNCIWVKIVNRLYSAHFPPIMTPDLREKILRKGPIQIVTEFPATNGRSFCQKYYMKQMPNGEQVKREWKVYSKSLDSIHCFCCRIFGILLTFLAFLLERALMIGSICHSLLRDMSSQNHISTIIPNGKSPQICFHPKEQLIFNLLINFNKRKIASNWCFRELFHWSYVLPNKISHSQAYHRISTIQAARMVTFSK